MTPTGLCSFLGLVPLRFSPTCTLASLEAPETWCGKEVRVLEIVKICALEDGGGYREGGLGQHSPRGKATDLDTHLGSGGLSCCPCWVLGQLWRKGVEGQKKRSQKVKGTSMLASVSLTSGMGSTQAHRLSPGTLSPHSAGDPLMSRNP